MVFPFGVMENTAKKRGASLFAHSYNANHSALMEYKAEMHRICVNIHGTKVASISYRAVITRWLFVGVALFMLYSFYQVKKSFWGFCFFAFPVG